MAWERIASGVWIAQAHLRRGDQRWYVIVKRRDYTAGRQRFFRGGPDRATALAVATQLTRRIGAIGSSRATVDQILEAYQREHIRTLRRETEKLQVGYIEHHLGPHFYGKTAADLTKADLFDFGAAMLDPLPDAEARARRFSTVKNCLSLLRAALRWYWRENEAALRDHSCPASHVAEQCRRIRSRYGISRRRRRPAYTPDQLRTLIGVAAKEDLLVHDLFAVAGGTGMRLSEILGIRWANIDELRCSIVPDEHGVISRIGKDGQPALYKHDREDPIAMAPGLLDLFRRRRQTRTSETWVFATKTGTPYVQANISKRIQKIRRAAALLGVPLDRSFHSTRHTFASMALEGGLSLEWIANQLGHHSPSFTAEVYIHLVERERDLSSFDFAHRSQSADNAHETGTDDAAKKLLN